MRTRPSHAASTRTARRLELEALHHRDVPSTVTLSGGVLTITGTTASEHVSVDIPTSGPSAGKLVVLDCYFDSTGLVLCGVGEFNPASVTQIRFYGDAGDDDFSNSTAKYC